MTSIDSSCRRAACAGMVLIVTDAHRVETVEPARTTCDFTTAQAVVAASEAVGRPVILPVAPKAAMDAQGLRLIRALRGPADDAARQVCVQLDHATDMQPTCSWVFPLSMLVWTQLWQVDQH